MFKKAITKVMSFVSLYSPFNAQCAYAGKLLSSTNCPLKHALNMQHSKKYASICSIVIRSITAVLRHAKLALCLGDRLCFFSSVKECSILYIHSIKTEV